MGDSLSKCILSRTQSSDHASATAQPTLSHGDLDGDIGIGKRDIGAGDPRLHVLSDRVGAVPSDVHEFQVDVLIVIPDKNPRSIVSLDVAEVLLDVKGKIEYGGRSETRDQGDQESCEQAETM